MSQASKNTCRHDLSFPYHFPMSAQARLQALAAFMDSRGFDSELFIHGQATELLEGQLAELFGKEAALWCPSGTMAQGIAARIYQRRSGQRRLLLHPTSHLVLHEEDGYRHAHGLEASLIGSWHEAIQADMLAGNAACAFVELPQRHSGGLLPSWSQLVALKQRAAQLALPLHMDGARIWSCLPNYVPHDFAEIADGFQSLYVSFYKDIGAISGAALIGDNEFISEAKIWRTRLGGLMAGPWPIICDNLRLLDHRLGQMAGFVVHAQAMAKALEPQPSIRIYPNPPQVNMFHIRLPCHASQALVARDQAASETGVWLGSRFWEDPERDGCALEIIVGEKAAALPIPLFAEAIACLLKEL